MATFFYCRFRAVTFYDFSIPDIYFAGANYDALKILTSTPFEKSSKSSCWVGLISIFLMNKAW